MAARARGMRVALLSGGTGGKLRPLCYVSVVVGASETFMVQELHLPCLLYTSNRWDGLHPGCRSR